MSSPKDEVVFDWDWLLLGKPQIEMLSQILLNGGTFAGNLSDLCRMLGNKNPSHKTRNKRKATIKALIEAGAIQYSDKTATKFDITICEPKEETKVGIDRSLLEGIMRHEYTRSVAKEQVLRVYLWLKQQGSHIAFRRHEVGQVLGVADDVITQACHVLDENYRVIALDQDREQIKLANGQTVPRCFGLLASLGSEFSEN